MPTVLVHMMQVLPLIVEEKQKEDRYHEQNDIEHIILPKRIGKDKNTNSRSIQCENLFKILPSDLSQPWYLNYSNAGKETSYDNINSMQQSMNDTININDDINIATSNSSADNNNVLNAKHQWRTKDTVYGNLFGICLAQSQDIIILQSTKYVYHPSQRIEERKNNKTFTMEHSATDTTKNIWKKEDIEQWKRLDNDILSIYNIYINDELCKKQKLVTHEVCSTQLLIQSLYLESNKIIENPKLLDKLYTLIQKIQNHNDEQIIEEYDEKRLRQSFQQQNGYIYIQNTMNQNKSYIIDMNIIFNHPYDMITNNGQIFAIYGIDVNNNNKRIDLVYGGRYDNLFNSLYGSTMNKQKIKLHGICAIFNQTMIYKIYYNSNINTNRVLQDQELIYNKTLRNYYITNDIYSYRCLVYVEDTIEKSQYSIWRLEIAKLLWDYQFIVYYTIPTNMSLLSIKRQCIKLNVRFLLLIEPQKMKKEQIINCIDLLLYNQGKQQLDRDKYNITKDRILSQNVKQIDIPKLLDILSTYTIATIKTIHGNDTLVYKNISSNVYVSVATILQNLHSTSVAGTTSTSSSSTNVNNSSNSNITSGNINTSTITTNTNDSIEINNTKNDIDIQKQDINSTIVKQDNKKLNISFFHTVPLSVAKEQTIIKYIEKQLNGIIDRLLPNKYVIIAVYLTYYQLRSLVTKSLSLQTRAQVTANTLPPDLLIISLELREVALNMLKRIIDHRNERPGTLLFLYSIPDNLVEILL